MIDRLWNPFIAAWFDGKDDPKLVLLRFALRWQKSGSRIESLAGVKMLFGVDPKEQYEIKSANQSSLIGKRGLRKTEVRFDFTQASMRAKGRTERKSTLTPFSVVNRRAFPSNTSLRGLSPFCGVQKSGVVHLTPFWDHCGRTHQPYARLLLLQQHLTPGIFLPSESPVAPQASRTAPKPIIHSDILAHDLGKHYGTNSRSPVHPHQRRESPNGVFRFASMLPESPKWWMSHFMP